MPVDNSFIFQQQNPLMNHLNMSLSTPIKKNEVGVLSNINTSNSTLQKTPLLESNKSSIPLSSAQLSQSMNATNINTNFFPLSNSTYLVFF